MSSVKIRAKLGKVSNPGGNNRNFDGKKAVADMLNVMDPETRKRLMGEIAAQAPDLIPELERRMFTFEDLIRYTDQEIQLLLKEVPRAKLALAIRTAPPPIKDLFYRNMSERSRALLEDEIQAQGLRRVSDVEAAQGEILKVARLKLGAR